MEGWLFLLKEIEIEMQIEKRKGKFEESEGDTVSEGISARYYVSYKNVCSSWGMVERFAENLIFRVIN